MISYLTLRIKKTQEYLWSIHGQDVAFVHVQVDHVDMKNFIDALGISISFIDPIGPELELVRTGVGLVESDTHTADQASQQALRVLHSRLGIMQNLILPVGVDTTTSALKTSRLISGSDEECEGWIHVLNLIIEYAMGIWVLGGGVVVVANCLLRIQVTKTIVTLS
jgi:hypothetical protein